MGAKDIAEKHLEELNDVFADIVNVLLFDGEQLVKENELETFLITLRRGNAKHIIKKVLIILSFIIQIGVKIHIYKKLIGVTVYQQAT